MKETYNEMLLKTALKLACFDLIEKCELPEFARNYSQEEKQVYKKECVEHAFDSYMNLSKFEDFKKHEFSRMEILEKKRFKLNQIKKNREDLRLKRQNKSKQLIEKSKSRRKNIEQ